MKTTITLVIGILASSISLASLPLHTKYRCAFAKEISPYVIELAVDTASTGTFTLLLNQKIIRQEKTGFFDATFTFGPKKAEMVWMDFGQSGYLGAVDTKEIRNGVACIQIPY